jgi:hypothetical protein
MAVPLKDIVVLVVVELRQLEYLRNGGLVEMVVMVVVYLFREHLLITPEVGVVMDIRLHPLVRQLVVLVVVETEEIRHH